MTRLVCLILLIGAVGCSGRYVGPGSGTRDERLQQREQKHAESTDPVDPRVEPVQHQQDADDGGIPAAR